MIKLRLNCEQFKLLRYTWYSLLTRLSDPSIPHHNYLVDSALVAAGFGNRLAAVRRGIVEGTHSQYSYLIPLQDKVDATNLTNLYYSTGIL